MTGAMILAHDLGTTGDKATLFDDTGMLIASAYEEYLVHLPKVNWAEQDPSDWWRAVVVSTRTLLQKSEVDPRNIAAVGFSGHMMSLLPVDRDGNPLTPALIHMDGRSISQYERLVDELGKQSVYQITGNILDSHYPICKILWLKENMPEVYSRTYKLLQSKDYIAFKLTGRLGTTDPSDASLTLMYDIVNHKWSDEIMAELGVPVSILPDVLKSTDIQGFVTKEASEATGLIAGTPVVVGGGDGVCATVGSGALAKGKAYNYIGGSSWVTIHEDRPLLDPNMRFFACCSTEEGTYDMFGTMLCGGSSFQWVRRELGLLENLAAGQFGESAYDLLGKTAEKSPPGAGGVIFMPHLMGERAPLWDPNAKGVFYGLSLKTTRDDLIRAVLEGVAFNLRAIERVYEELGIDIKSISLIGGGAKGATWRKILTNVYGRRTTVPRYIGEATSFGAAIVAGVGVGVFKDLGESIRLVKETQQEDPEPELMKIYDKRFRVFESLYPALKDVFAQSID